MLVERFLVARGTLFDVLAAEDAYFETAAAYIQALSELDAARYVLLSRTGKLLDALDIDRRPRRRARMSEPSSSIEMPEAALRAVADGADAAQHGRPISRSRSRR